MTNHMTEYTADDFAKAMFAEHPDPDAVDARYAARMNRDPEYPWLLDGVPGNGDEHMARDGWVPVVESRVTEHTLRDSQEKAEKKRQKLLDHIASLEAIIRRRNDQIERQEDQIAKLTDERDAYGRTVDGLRDELREKAVPLSLDALEAAWENAERADECRKGDVLIARKTDDYRVYVATIDDGLFSETVRILSRAPRREPQREPWADLDDAIASSGVADGISAEDLAVKLHEQGWRKTGGDEK